MPDCPYTHAASTVPAKNLRQPWRFSGAQGRKIPQGMSFFDAYLLLARVAGESQ
jgi:hypothetical protein